MSSCERLSPEERAAAQAHEQWQLVDRYGVDDHNDAELAGELSLDVLSSDSIAAYLATFEKVVRKFARDIDAAAEGAAAGRAAALVVRFLGRNVAGSSRRRSRAAAHRVAPAEPQGILERRPRSAHMPIDAAAILPQDEQVEGFDNIAAALQVSPSFIEQYLIAARTVALQAVGRGDARAGSTTYNAAPACKAPTFRACRSGHAAASSRSTTFRPTASTSSTSRDMAGHIWGNDMEFENTVLVTLDSKEIYRTVIGGDAHMKRYDQEPAGAFDFINATLKNIRFTTTAGPHKLGVAPHVRRVGRPYRDVRAGRRPGARLSREAVRVAGPFNPTGLSSMPSRERIFELLSRPRRGRRIVRRGHRDENGSRAFRRPIAENDLGRLMQYYRDGAAQGGFEAGIRSAVTGILASPYFLYRGERVPTTLAAGAKYRIDDLELASKLLCSSSGRTTPYDELREVAARGQLSAPTVFRQQLDLMLRAPRAGTLSTNFVYQWLDMARLDEVEPDRAVFPYAAGGGDPRADYMKELELFAQSIFDEDRSVLEFLTAKHTYVNERVALLYGVNGVKGEWFQRVELDDSTRWGLLGKGAILMAAAYPNRTSPVLARRLILEHITGTPPAAPPPDVEALPEDESTPGTIARTVRERWRLTASIRRAFLATGFSTRSGFALENFDAVGTLARARPLRAASSHTTGSLPDGTHLAGPDDLREALLRRPDQFVQTFTERLMTYALGRTLDHEDMPTVRKIVRDAASEDYRFSAIVRGIVESERFLERQVPATLTAQSTSVN